MIGKIFNLLLMPFKWLFNLVLKPFKYLIAQHKERKLNQEKTTRINLIKDYIKIAKNNSLEIMITANYENELIINLMTREAKKGMAKKIKIKEEKENEK